MGHQDINKSNYILYKLGKDLSSTNKSNSFSLKKNPALREAIAGAIAGAVSTALTLPLDTVQIQESMSRKSRYEIIKDLYREGKGQSTGAMGVLKGLARFYKGMGTKVIKVAPTMAISFPVFNYVVRKFNERYNKH